MLRFVLAAVVAAFALVGAAESKPVWRHYPPYVPLPTQFITFEPPSAGPVWRHYRAPISLAAPTEATAATEAPVPPVEAAPPVPIPASAAEPPPMPEPAATAAKPVVVAAESPVPTTTPAQTPEARPAEADIAAAETPGSSDPRGQILLGLFFSAAVLAAIFFLGRRGFRRS